MVCHNHCTFSLSEFSQSLVRNFAIRLFVLAVVSFMTMAAILFLHPTSVTLTVVPGLQLRLLIANVSAGNCLLAASFNVIMGLTSHLSTGIE